MSRVTAPEFPKSIPDLTTTQLGTYPLLHYQSVVFGNWILSWTTHDHLIPPFIPCCGIVAAFFTVQRRDVFQDGLVPLCIACMLDTWPHGKAG